MTIDWYADAGFSAFFLLCGEKVCVGFKESVITSTILEFLSDILLQLVSSADKKFLLQ